jgi:hypothetical protein
VDQLGAPDAPSLLDIEGGFSDRQNKLEAAMDQVQQKLGENALQTGRMFQRHRKLRRGKSPEID